MKLYFVRHGDTQRGKNGTYGYEAPLTELGHSQAALVCRALGERRITHIVASDATRAMQTAEPLALALGMTLTLVPELIEINVGIPSDGVTPFVANRNIEGQPVLDYAHHGGESWDVFSARVLVGVSVLAERFADGDVVAVFTHGGVKSVLLDHYSGRELSQAMHTLYDNCSISTIESNGIGHMVHGVNDVSHLV